MLRGHDDAYTISLRLVSLPKALQQFLVQGLRDWNLQGCGGWILSLPKIPFFGGEWVTGGIGPRCKCISVCLSVYLSIYLSIDLSIHPSIYVCSDVYIYIRMYIYIIIYICQYWVTTHQNGMVSTNTMTNSGFLWVHTLAEELPGARPIYVKYNELYSK